MPPEQRALDDPHAWLDRARSNLTTLLDLVAQSGITVAESVREAGRLTRFAGVTRYPSLGEPITQEEYEKQLP